jgi:hypothetical protein
MMKSSSRIQHHRRYGSPTSVGLAHLGIVRVFGRDHHPLRIEPHVASQNQRQAQSQVFAPGVFRRVVGPYAVGLPTARLRSLG